MDWDELTYMGETIELDGDSLEQLKPTYWRRTNEQTASHQHAAREAASPRANGSRIQGAAGAHAARSDQIMTALVQPDVIKMRRTQELLELTHCR